MEAILDFFGGDRAFEPAYVWQDREIRFDVPVKDLKVTVSEAIIEHMARHGVADSSHGA